MWATADFVRRHWMFWLLLAGGLVLRGIAQIAYEPALLFIDSKKYIFGTDFTNTIWGSFDPLGYSLLILRPILLAGRSLAYAALAQHVLGMAMAGALYALMVRRGVYRGLAALAVAPVLLDAYQLNAEQTIMPDVLFEALLVAGIVLLLWRPRPGLFLIILGGLALGASAPVRQVGEALIAPALIYVVFAAQGWRKRLLHGAVLTACFALPRNTEQGDTPISRWQFQFGYPYYPPGITRHGYNSASKVFAKAGGGGHARVHWKPDIALRYYQLHGGYTPGPVFLFGLLAGIGGIFTFRRRRDSGPALACLLITGCAVAVLLGADLYEFSWRYQLPALVTLPVAAAFGVTALVGFFGARRQGKAAAGAGGAAEAFGTVEVAEAVEMAEAVGAGDAAPELSELAEEADELAV